MNVIDAAYDLLVQLVFTFAFMPLTCVLDRIRSQLSYDDCGL